MHQNRRFLIASALAGTMALTGHSMAQIPTRTPATTAPARPAAPQQQQSQPQPQPQATEQQSIIGPPPSGVAPAGYKIGPDDVIDANVLGQPDFRTRARVNADGTVTLPYLGSVPAQGETSTSMAEKLRKLLQAGGYYAKPIVSVEIVNFVSNYITVLGQIGTPGLQSVDRGYHVSEVIARAGGLRADAADFVVLTRKDGPTLKLDYKKLVQGGGEDDPMIAAGDKLFVPEAEKVYVSGQVNSPGVYAFKQDMTVRRLIAQSGGLTAAGSAKKVKVTRDGKELKLKMEDMVKPGDTIVVGERLF